MDYCSQLWAPSRASDLLRLEKIQKNFLRKIPSLSHLSYWDHLESLKMYLIQQRLERYRVIYIWKLIEGIVPDCGVRESHNQETRLGRRVAATNGPGRSTLTGQTLQVQGSKLFNSIPRSIRNLSGCGPEEFKFHLDEYLTTLYDEPPTPGSVPRGVTENGSPSNSILHQKSKVLEGGALRSRDGGERVPRRRWRQAGSN